MLRFGVLAVLASGCRVNFGSQPDANGNVDAVDAAADALLGHDEDGDGIPDTADFCPHIPEAANLDSDGDLVGDVCDRNSASAKQSWLLFSPMGALPGFQVGPTGAWTMNGDDWHYDDVASQSQLIRDGLVRDVDVWVGFDVETLGTGGIQAAIVINGSAPYWYAELFDGGQGNSRLSITEYDGSNFIARASMVTGATFPTGRTDLYLSTRGAISFTAISGPDMVTYLTPAYAGDQFLDIAFGNHSGRVRYVAIVTSQ